MEELNKGIMEKVCPNCKNTTDLPSYVFENEGVYAFNCEECAEELKVTVTKEFVYAVEIN